MKLYSVYDKVSKRFNAPFVAENDEVANRSFQLGVKDNPFSEDFDLYDVGTFNFDACLTTELLSGYVPKFVSHYIGEVIENG